MENFKLCTELDFDNAEFNKLLKNMQKYFENQEKNFCKICFCVYQISTFFDTHSIGAEKKTNEYYDKNKLFEKFGFDKTAVSRLTNCYLKFMTGTDEKDIEHTKGCYYLKSCLDVKYNDRAFKNLYACQDQELEEPSLNTNWFLSKEELKEILGKNKTK